MGSGARHPPTLTCGAEPALAASIWPRNRFRNPGGCPAQVGRRYHMDSREVAPVVPSRFPGMDPYLEDHVLWHGVHTWFIAVLGEVLGPQLPERYYVEIEERFYIGDVSEPHRSGVADALVAREATFNGGPN